jgi:phage terminase large subunit-like protein
VFLCQFLYFDRQKSDAYISGITRDASRHRTFWAGVVT